MSLGKRLLGIGAADPGSVDSSGIHKAGLQLLIRMCANCWVSHIFYCHVFIGLLDQWLIEGKFTEQEALTQSYDMLAAGMDTVL